jgi:hypothetical protein
LSQNVAVSNEAVSGVIGALPVTVVTLFTPNSIIGKSVKLYDPTDGSKLECGTIEAV